MLVCSFHLSLLLQECYDVSVIKEMCQIGLSFENSNEIKCPTCILFYEDNEAYGSVSHGVLSILKGQ